MTNAPTTRDDAPREPLWRWRAEWPHLGILAAMFAAAAWTWPQVTPPLPTHWNIRGEADGFGGRFEALLLVPLIALGLYVLLLVLPRIDPARANYASFLGPYRIIRLAMICSMGAMQAFVVSAAFGVGVDAGRWIPVGVGVLLVVIGNVMGKVRPNYFVGVRTPWTLASARSWEATNRLGGRLFVIAGVLLAVFGYLGSPMLMAVLGGFGVLAFAWLLWVSYREWRDDPDRVPASGTRPEPR